MAALLYILGIRHHGPGSARMVAAALEQIRPDAVLIEGPPDAAEVLGLASHAAMRPPVALLVYEPEVPQNAAYYPFAEFSPEWQGIRWAGASGAELRFIDLPFANRVAPEPKPESVAGDDEGADESEHGGSDDAGGLERKRPRAVDPLDQLASAAGFADGEAWWNRLIEERRGEENPLAVFDAIREAMAAAREHCRDLRHDPDEPAREAHMRRCIRAAIKEGFANIAVICGAWHAPVLTAEALKETPAKSDDAVLKGLPKRKTAATWIPWTYSRLAAFSGYSAGVLSPGWYEHLWVHHAHEPQRLSVAWMSRVARLMREEGMDASPAHIIESVRLADSLAALRSHSTTGLEELTEATLSVVCGGNPLPLRVIERRLIVGEKLGEVPEEAPTVPLQRDLAAQQKKLRLKISADDVVLDLDQRKELDLARSHLLHRLILLGIDWGVPHAEAMRNKGTFRESWKLQWRPELAVSVIEAAQWGNTVEEAAGARVGDRAARATDLPALTGMLEHAMLADLPRALDALLARIEALAAVAADMGHLMRALPPMAGVLRYGNVRRTDAALVEPIVRGLSARICAGVLPACASLNDDAAAEMLRNINGVHTALVTLAMPDLLEPWQERLGALAEVQVHGLVAGRAMRLLLDSQARSVEEAERGLSLALSRGNDAAKASAWLEGFLSGSGSILVHDPRLLMVIDAWVCEQSGDAFEQLCPLVRRTFSTFEAPERRQIGQALKRTGGAAPAQTMVQEDGYNAERGALVVPVLQLILGEEIE